MDQAFTFHKETICFYEKILNTENSKWRDYGISNDCQTPS